MDEWKSEKTEALPMAKDTFFEREDLGWTTFVRDKQGRNGIRLPLCRRAASHWKEDRVVRKVAWESV
jgi:hypothetical protein